MSSEQARTVEIDRLRISVVVRPGSGDGAPLLLCNGLGAGHETLKPFVDALDEQITAIRFDAPGVGASSAPRLPLSFAGLGRIATRLVSELGYDVFDVLGVSWGGSLAQQIAFQNARRCRRMVLAATSTGWTSVPAKPGVVKHLLTPWRYIDPGHARSVAGSVYGGEVREHPELVDPWVYDGGVPPSVRGYAYQWLATVGWTSLPVLHTIHQPTLVLAGTDDPIMPATNSRMLARFLPNARLHTYDDGHLALSTRADELAPVVAGFLLED